MRIVELKASNVKRLTAVEIAPDADGGLVVVSGKNGAGKSSVLDSIAYALGGSALIPAKPLRRGAKRGEVSVDLGDVKVTRTFTASGGGSLVVANRDGARYPSPQRMLDTLLGPLTFDPLAFARMPAREQREALKRLVGLDLSAIDAQAKTAYEDRAGRNREVKRLEGVVESAPSFPDAPAAEVSVAELAGELDDANREALRISTLDAQRDLEANAQLAAQGLVEQRDRELDDLRRRIETLENDRSRAVAAIDVHRDACNRLSGVISAALEALPDRDAMRARLAAVETENRMFWANVAREARVAELEQARRLARELTGRLDELDRERAQAIAEAPLPVDGLGFDELGVTFDGLPFEQASSAEQLRVSVAMGLAANPSVRVLLIRDGSLLDDDNLRLVAEMAEAAEAQVWVERVEIDAATSVVIEDGAVRGTKGKRDEKP